MVPLILGNPISPMKVNPCITALRRLTCSGLPVSRAKPQATGFTVGFRD